MTKKLKLILKQVPFGLEPTPQQSAQRERFTEVAHECKETFKDSQLKGTAKILAMNRFMSQRLRSREPGSP